LLSRSSLLSDANQMTPIANKANIPYPIFLRFDLVKDMYFFTTLQKVLYLACIVNQNQFHEKY